MARSHRARLHGATGHVRQGVPHADRRAGPYALACGFVETRRAQRGPAGNAGSTLVEVLVATLVIATGLLVMAQLLSVSTTNNVSSRSTTVATILAAQKLEQLRALAWGMDAEGRPISDLSTDTAVAPESPTGGTGLQISPAGALHQNTAGFVDYLSPAGEIMGGGTQPPRQALYTRRWSIEPMDGSDSALILQVLVTRSRDSDTVNRRNVGRLPGEARIMTVKVRKAP